MASKSVASAATALADLLFHYADLAYEKAAGRPLDADSRAEIRDAVERLADALEKSAGYGMSSHLSAYHAEQV